MFISKMSLPRRTFLRGMGATLALPLLEAMVPALTARARRRPIRRRFGAVFVPLGERPGYWTPKTVGENFEFTPILKPLEPFRDHLTVVTELCDPLDGHATTVAAWLSGAMPKRTIAEDVHSRASPSIRSSPSKIGQDTPFPSLELATEDFTGYIGGCDTAYSCAYMNTISWTTPTTPLPMEINPRVVFERMFGRPAPRAQRLARMHDNRSILDSVRDEVARPAEDARAAGSGAARTSISTTSARSSGGSSRPRSSATTEMTVPDAPIGVPDSFEEHVGAACSTCWRWPTRRTSRGSSRS